MRHVLIRKGSLESSGRQEGRFSCADWQIHGAIAHFRFKNCQRQNIARKQRRSLAFAPFRRGLVVERSDLLSGGAYCRGVGMVYVICVSDLGKDGFHGCFKDVREWARFTHHCFFTCAIMNWVFARVLLRLGRWGQMDQELPINIAGCARKVFLVCEFPSLAPPPLVRTRTWLGAYY